MTNLLVNSIFQATTSEGVELLNLPELLAKLGDGQVKNLPGLQRYQEDIFHIFLCYIAGAVLAIHNETEPKQTADFWRNGLRLLTKRDDDLAWTLVTDDPTQPAFMQPPSSSQDIFDREYKLRATTPDYLTTIYKAKNHDVKANQAIKASLEMWAIALVVLQTSSGFLGLGNYGIARMNSGTGSRVCVCWRADTNLSTNFYRETSVLIKQRANILNNFPYYQDGGKILLWTEPWDGKDSLPLSELDPFFIEVCRRVKLIKKKNSIVALGATSKVLRLLSKEFKGNIGDPWTPINEKENKALTVSKNGFTLKLLRNLIFNSEYSFTPMQATQPYDGWFYASALARDNGKTEGFHEKAVWIPKNIKSLMLSKTKEYNRLATLSQKGIDLAAIVQNKILKPALQTLIKKGSKQNEILILLSEPFVLKWESNYFKWLWSTVNYNNEAYAINVWAENLQQFAKDSLNQAIENAPMQHGWRYKSITDALNMFNNCLKKQYSAFMEK